MEGCTNRKILTKAASPTMKYPSGGRGRKNETSPCGHPVFLSSHNLSKVVTATSERTESPTVQTGSSLCLSSISSRYTGCVCIAILRFGNKENAGKKKMGNSLPSGWWSSEDKEEGEEGVERESNSTSGVTIEYGASTPSSELKGIPIITEGGPAAVRVEEMLMEEGTEGGDRASQEFITSLYERGYVIFSCDGHPELRERVQKVFNSGDTYFAQELQIKKNHGKTDISQRALNMGYVNVPGKREYIKVIPKLIRIQVAKVNFAASYR